MGVQMVSRGRYEQAVAVLDAICEGYPFHESFVAGQVSAVACTDMLYTCTLVSVAACACIC
jgi:hypothetical protein